MTVTVSYSPLTYNCNGSTTAFSVTWPFFLSSDLVVTHITSGGVETVLALTTDYTVSGGRDSTTGLPAVGTVTTLSTYASGVKIRITRSTPRTQSTSFTTAGAFPAKTVEAMIDRVHMIAEEGAGGSPAQDVDGASLRLETGGATDYWDGESYIARGFADGVNDDDLATVGQIQPFVDDAEAAAAAAATSQSAAATSATAAASSATAAASSATSASSSASAASTSATNASSSASAASTSASNAATSATEAAAAVGFVFTYSTTTTMADPGSGTVRFNNATLASVTAIAIDDLSADNGNPDVSAWILTFDNSSATNKGTLRFRKKSAPQNFVDFTVTGLTDNSGWTELAVTHAASSGSLSNADTLLMAFYATGDVGPAGPAGSGSGDVNGPASSVASEIALFDGTTGKLIKRATTTGIIKATSGVIAAAVSGTDYAPATSGSAILKGNGAGGFSSAVASTDYAPATSGTAILKGNGSGGFSAAVANTDYVGTTRNVGTSTGLSGGGDLSTNRTIALDVNALTEDTSPDTSSDFVLMYDTSASGHKKVKPSNFATSYAPDVQTFSSSGTWTKPASGTFAIVELWGGGGSGAKGASAGGGGGGAYIRFQKPLSELGATETVTIGAGGAAKATGGNGNAGGNSSFGSHATAYGGAGGLATGHGGGGGGVFSAASGATGGGGGTVSTAGGTGGDGSTPWPPVSSDWGGGGGGYTGGSGQSLGAKSVFGGGGGGGSARDGGASLFGGNGGAGSATTGTAGSAKGGGGGSGNSGNSGAGGDGYCRVWVM